ERDAANANLELSNKTGAFRAAAAQAGVNPDASHNTLRNSAVATEYAAMLAAEADAEAAERQLATAQADIEQMKNSPMPGTTVAGGYTTNPDGYHLLLSGVSSPTLGAGALDFPPGDAALDTDLALLMSNTYVKQSLGELRPAANYRGQLRHLVENGGVWTAGAELDLWTDAPDQASMAPRPDNIQSGAPNVLMVCANIQSILDWWGYAAVLDVGIKEVRVLPVNDAAPDQPIAELVFRAELTAGASHFIAVAYEVCEDVSHILPRLGELGGERPPLPLIGMEVAGRFHRVTEARGPSFAGVWPADMVDREVRFVYGQAVDAASGRRHGGRVPRGGGFVPAGGSPVPGGDLFPLDYRPGPDHDFPPQEPGALLCECRVGWDTEESESWLTAAVEARVSVFIGIKTVLDYTDLSTLKFLPHISYRFSLDSLTPVGNLAIQASGPLAGLDSNANANWLQTQLHQHIRWRLARSRYATSGPGGGGDLKYLYGANIPATLEPEGFAPAVALAWNPELVIEPFPGIDVRPPLITLRTFGNDPDRLNVAIRMHLLENILQQL
ncbi:MAG: hypothetical protein ACE5FM_08195, partial [Methyloligellaceae bacterium]